MNTDKIPLTYPPTIIVVINLRITIIVICIGAPTIIVVVIRDYCHDRDLGGEGITDICNSLVVSVARLHPPGIRTTRICWTTERLVLEDLLSSADLFLTNPQDLCDADFFISSKNPLTNEH